MNKFNFNSFAIPIVAKVDRPVGQSTTKSTYAQQTDVNAPVTNLLINNLIYLKKMKHLKFLQTTLLLVVLTVLTALSTSAQTIRTLPSINGTPCVSCAPAGWSYYTPSPDLISGNGIFPSMDAFASDIVGTSLDGGSMAFSGGTPSLAEELSATLTGLVVGQTYRVPVQWQQATFTDVSGVYSGGKLKMRAVNANISQTFTSNNTPELDTWQVAVLTFTATAVQETIVVGATSSGPTVTGIIVFDGGDLTSLLCTAGTTAPALSAITKANTCPATTVNLTTITASNTPAGTTLTWHTGTPATTANKVTGTAQAAGTYYAAFFDATNNCYSGTAGAATTAVTATVSACVTCNAGSVAPILVKN